MIFEKAIRDSAKAAIEAVQPLATVKAFWSQPRKQEMMRANYLGTGAAAAQINAWLIFLQSMRPHQPANPAGTQGWVLQYGVWHFLEYADTQGHADTLYENASLGLVALNGCEFTIRRLQKLGASLDLVERIQIDDRVVSLAQVNFSIQTWRTGDEAS